MSDQRRQMSGEMDRILDECLELLAGGRSIEECAALHPEHREALVPLLEIASATRLAVESVSFRPEARARGLERLSQALAEGRSPRRWRPGLPAFRLAARPVAAAVAAIAVLVVTAAWTSAASSDSVPGDALYWVKTTKESFLLTVRRSDEDRAQVHANLARVRGQEMGRLIASGRVLEAEGLLQEVHHHLRELAGHAGVVVPANPIEAPVGPVRLGGGNTAVVLSLRLARDEQWLGARLDELLNAMSPDMRPRVESVRRQSDVGYRAVIAALQAGGSSELRPFWRNETARLRTR